MSRRSSHIIIFTLLLALGAASCKHPQTRAEFSTDALDLRDGDLIFRRGRGAFSRFLPAESRFGKYTHSGIVFSSDSGWTVIHAVPFEDAPDRVKVEKIESFLSEDKASAFELCHIKADIDVNALRARAFSMVGREFDHQYDLSDTSRVYCTEFVLISYICAGTDLSEGRRTSIPALSLPGEVLLPEDIRSSSSIETYFRL